MATINKLIEIRLTTLADAYWTQLSGNSTQTVSFEDRLGLLVDIKYTTRKNNRRKTVRVTYSTKYIRLPELLSELAVAKGEGNKETVKQCPKYILLVLDEWLPIKLTETEARN